VVSLAAAHTRPSPEGRDAVSRLHCWPSNDVRKTPVRRADAEPGRPVRLPRRGRQSVSWPGGFEAWVGEDKDLDAAWGITPARFLFERALPQLVELPSLWTSIPLGDRDVEDLIELVDAVVVEHALPRPHLIVSGQGRVVVLWHIRPLHYPAALKAGATDADKALHERQTIAFRRCLRDWKRAAVKLRLAFAGIGALPHTPATVEEQLLEYIPFPLDPSSPARLVNDLVDDAPRAWLIADHDPVLIKDVSMALSAFDQQMWTTFKEARPRRGRTTRWLESEATKAALQTTEQGDRHKAAVTIVCACVWDGLSEDETLATLREWAARCSHDGRFPWRRHSGDELEHVLAWGFKRLRPGGPTPRDADLADGPGRKRGITPFDMAAAAVLAWIASEAGPDGLVATTLPELRKEAALASMAPGASTIKVAGRIARTTLKRALAALKAQGLLEQEVVRVGRTWCSRFRLPQPAIPEVTSSAQRTAIPMVPEVQSSQVQKRESLWAPRSHRGSNGGGLGDASPSGRGVRGEGEGSSTPSSRNPGANPGSPADPTTDPIDVDPTTGDLADHLGPATETPETDSSSASPTGRPTRQKRPRRRQRSPRLLALPFIAPAEDAVDSPRPRRRRRRRDEETVPPLTDLVLQELRGSLIDATVRPHRLAAGLPDVLDDDALRAVLEEARNGLTPRPRLKDRFVDILRRQAQRLLRLEAFAEVSRQTAEARKKRDAAPPPVPVTPSAPPPGFDPADPFAVIRQAQRRPLHELHPKERARRLSALELSLVVLSPRSKEPPPGSSWTSAQVTRTRLPVLDRQLDEQGDEAGLAIVCGPVSGIVAVDLDDDSAVAWARANLPKTPWRTRTGRGEHWFYRLPEGWSPPAKLPYKGQLQSTGRYVVAPGSIHPDTGRVYEAHGDWTRPRSDLPLFRNEWLLDSRVLREQRLRVLKPDDE
jgi:hypothetical protein